MILEHDISKDEILECLREGMKEAMLEIFAVDPNFLAGLYNNEKPSGEE